ncbi:DUF732 domain-containing protein [Mycobacteroides abscessus]|uniref:DUF732 domain-containing protein n=1 Tax=Mycobacteroides abscessus TaxID=36809 RepID=UPI0009A8AEC4|nr:Conserved exported protein of uncharacterised function (modular protein) [Mycobacteroides abscessus subsp. bolletii]
MIRSITAAVVLSLAFSPNAFADALDDQFVEHLRSVGIKVADSHMLVGNTAKTVCQMSQMGYGRAILVGTVQQDYPEYSDQTAGRFVSVAINNYCPS